MDPPNIDESPPRFILPPKVDYTAESHAGIKVALNEAGNLNYVIRKEPSFSLTPFDLQQSPDSITQGFEAFESVRIELTDLEPATEYHVYLGFTDLKGNGQPEVAAASFKTAAADNEAVTLPEAVPPAYQGVFWQFEPESLPPGCFLKLMSAPAWMHVTTNGRGIAGLPEWLPGQATATFSFAVSGAGCRGQFKKEVGIAGDPLFPYAWHINPKSNQSFSWLGFVPRFGMDLGKLVAEGLTGRGVTVTVVDSGMQIDHPDLVNNIVVENNVNLDPFKPGGCLVCDPFDTTPPLEPGEPGDQGTAVAGLIAAVGWNGIGSRGVAPHAKISAYNLSARRFAANEADHIGAYSVKSDIICHSAAPSEPILEAQPQIDFGSFDRAQKARVSFGRDGKGTIIVKAAGDMHNRGGHAALDPLNSTSWGIVVTSHNSIGEKSAAAHGGANVWISAPGGEAGFQSDFQQLQNTTPIINFYPSLITADIFSHENPCSVGYAKDRTLTQPGIDLDPRFHALGRSSGFNLGWHDLNPDCHYTATVPATPASTAVVAGVVALMLEANPDLGWRTVKDILARTARPIDQDRPAEVTTVDGVLFERTLSWQTNAAGLSFHNWYGFGGIDAEAAVAAAASVLAPQFPALFDTGWMLASGASLWIPRGSVAGVFSDFTSVHDIVIESVQIRLSITHPNMTHIGIELVSPSGTRSILKPVQDGAVYSNLRDFVLLSNAFYGEVALGKWQLRVIDGKESNARGFVSDWSIRFAGHQRAGGS